MSEYTQVDLQIGTEDQFDTKKANLSEGVIVGLTDPIHENDLDSDLQTKLNSGIKIYKHAISIPCSMSVDTTGMIFTLKVNIISTSSAAYTFSSFCTELINGTDKTMLPCFALTPSGSDFTTGAIMVYNLTASNVDSSFSLTAKALLFEDFDGASQPERELTGSENISDVNFSDTVTQL